MIIPASVWGDKTETQHDLIFSKRCLYGPKCRALDQTCFNAGQGRFEKAHVRVSMYSTVQALWCWFVFEGGRTGASNLRLELLSNEL